MNYFIPVVGKLCPKPDSKYFVFWRATSSEATTQLCSPSTEAVVGVCRNRARLCSNATSFLRYLLWCLLVCMYSTLHAWHPWRSEEGVGSSETNLGSLQVQRVLAAEPSLQPPGRFVRMLLRRKQRNTR